MFIIEIIILFIRPIIGRMSEIEKLSAVSAREPSIMKVGVISWKAKSAEMYLP